MSLSEKLSCFKDANKKIEENNNKEPSEAYLKTMEKNINKIINTSIENNQSIIMSDKKFRTSFTL